VHELNDWPIIYLFIVRRNGAFNQLDATRWMLLNHN